MKRILLALGFGLITQSQFALAGFYDGSSYGAPYHNEYIGRQSLVVLSQTPKQLVEIVGVKDNGGHSYSALMLHVQYWGNNRTGHSGYFISTEESDVFAIVQAVCHGKTGKYVHNLMGDASFARIAPNLEAEAMMRRKGDFLDSIYCD